MIGEDDMERTYGDVMETTACHDGNHEACSYGGRGCQCPHHDRRSERWRRLMQRLGIRP